MKKRPTFQYIITICIVLAALAVAMLLYFRYSEMPWTRDGQVQANVVGIAPRVSGPIIQIPLIDNQEVKKGDFLFEIDPATFQAAVDNAQGMLMKAEANFVQSSQELDRQTQLFKTQVVDLRDLQNAQDNYNAAKAEQAAAQANVNSAQLNLQYTKVFAPVDGYVTNMNTSPGTYVNEGDQLLALVDKNSFWIAGYFKETQIRHIKAGDKARVHLMGHYWEPMEGVVHSVGWGIFVQNGATVNLLPQVNQTIDWVRLPNRFPVRIHLAGESIVPLRIGQTVSVSITRDSEPRTKAEKTEKK